MSVQPAREWKITTSDEGLSTLLGPEGSVAQATPSSGRLTSSFTGLQVTRTRPHFENFTVDASIFVVNNKLLRAIGGCLGTKSR